jgi:hypothetical protein
MWEVEDVGKGREGIEIYIAPCNEIFGAIAEQYVVGESKVRLPVDNNLHNLSHSVRTGGIKDQAIGKKLISLKLVEWSRYNRQNTARAMVNGYTIVTKAEACPTYRMMPTDH